MVGDGNGICVTTCLILNGMKETNRLQWTQKGIAVINMALLQHSVQNTFLEVNVLNKNKFTSFIYWISPL